MKAEGSNSDAARVGWIGPIEGEEVFFEAVRTLLEALELPVETLLEVLYKAASFTSPVGEVVAWGEDTWPSGWGLWEAPARLFF